MPTPGPTAGSTPTLRGVVPPLRQAHARSHQGHRLARAQHQEPRGEVAGRCKASGIPTSTSSSSPSSSKAGDGWKPTSGPSPTRSLAGSGHGPRTASNTSTRSPRGPSRISTWTRSGCPIRRLPGDRAAQARQARPQQHRSRIRAGPHETYLHGGADPGNVVAVPQTYNQHKGAGGHTAAMPEGLAEFFIKAAPRRVAWSSTRSPDRVRLPWWRGGWAAALAAWRSTAASWRRRANACGVTRPDSIPVVIDRARDGSRRQRSSRRRCILSRRNLGQTRRPRPPDPTASRHWTSTRRSKPRWPGSSTSRIWHRTMPTCRRSSSMN